MPYYDLLIMTLRVIWRLQNRNIQTDNISFENVGEFKAYRNENQQITTAYTKTLYIHKHARARVPRRPITCKMTAAKKQHTSLKLVHIPCPLFTTHNYFPHTTRCTRSFLQFKTSEVGDRSTLPCLHTRSCTWSKRPRTR